ncbi:MAG: hypothetical protein R3261_08110 [Alphaproteobacteria bacterium]|nr:hypothetical protein [Alphaproteobacteria bacterium]
MSEFKKQLNSHLKFIARSCEDYDQGHKDEALRIAVSLRVLFHDTNKSTSLLNYLKKKDTINLISTFVPPDVTLEGAENVEWHTVLPLMITSNGVQSPLDSWAVRSTLPVEKWWNEKIWVEGRTILTRRDIVLSAANQDGGAHVDGKPSGKTKMVKKGPDVKIKINGIEVPNAMENHHYPLLRQIAFEILNSPEMVELTI